MKFQTYLFDFDGTLVDSMPAYVSVMLRILEENNIAYAPDIVKTITPLGYRGTARYFKTLGLSKTEEEIVSAMHAYATKEYTYHIGAKKNVIETLHKLKEAGADLHVLTASPHEMLDVCLQRLGIYALFDNVWSCDDFDTTKADVQIYKMAAARIGKPIEKILFLDDNYNADKTAKQSGIKVCGVYDASSADAVEAIKGITDYYIDDFAQLLTL